MSDIKMLYVKDLINYCNGELICGNLEDTLENFSKDTRTIKENDIYIGIKGENYDGSLLYEEALEKGAKGVIINDNVVIQDEVVKKHPSKFIVSVKDTITAIGLFAKYKRSLYDIPFVGVTGSVGKTSTKDLIASVLRTKYKVLSTIGNYNNNIGLPLTLLGLKDEEICVIEMGMNNLGEIDYLSNILKPTLSVITNIGSAHIGNLGSRENILKAKLEILNGMEEKKLVINNDNDLLHEFYLANYENISITTYGIENASDYNAINIINKENCSTYDTKDCKNIKVNTPGDAYVYNSLCAYAVGKLFDIDDELIKKGIENYELSGKRMEFINTNKFTIINDSYNANFESMKNSIKYLSSLNNRKVAILGDMLELGEYSKQIHEELAEFINTKNLDAVYTIGKETTYTNEKINKDIFHCHFESNEEFLENAEELLNDGDTILVKASNAMKFYEIIEYISKM